MSHIQQLKSLLQERNNEAIPHFIQENKEVLKEKDENDVSGLLLLAYHSTPKVVDKVASLAESFDFYESIVYGKADNVKAAIEQDAELINSFSPDGFSAVALAVFFGKKDIASMLLDKGANPQMAARNISKVNALHAAVARNNFELCKMLVDKGIDVNQPQMSNITPLHSAVHRANMDIVKLLVENGANVNAKMDGGDTPVDIAEKEGHEEIKAYLISNG